MGSAEALYDLQKEQTEQTKDRTAPPVYLSGS